MAITVRAASLPDLDTVVALRLALLREHQSNALFERLHPEADARAREVYAAHLASTEQTILLAERDGAAIGILRCVHAISSPLLLPEAYGYMSSAYVVPGERRAGILSALFDEGVRWCRSRGLAEIRLYVSVDDDVARSAWSSLGFAPVEELRILRLAPEGS
ncbi:MAG TPA: GNAT family N-acetyltransferase [Gemmatimonadaceae bacterium]|nr:GNAT family N-acetyltransferase [Gemmatimonadaceae bacterium]